MIEPPLLMRLGAAASIAGHMVVLTLGLLFADAHPYESQPSEAIAIDIVAPEQAEALSKPAEPAKPEPKPPDPIDFSALTAPIKPQASLEPPGQRAQQQKSQAAAAAAPRTPPPAPPAAATQAAAKTQGAETAPQAPMQPPAGPRQPEPDITVKYGVLLGLPPATPPANDFSGVEAPAFQVAKVSAEDIAAFRRHLKTCSLLPASVAPTDRVRIVLRVLLSRDGKLASDPALLEASASAKGPLLMQKAISALQACQPYAMLPADKYNEWKVLDLSFTPQDFSGG